MSLEEINISSKPFVITDHHGHSTVINEFVPDMSNRSVCVVIDNININIVDAILCKVWQLEDGAEFASDFSIPHKKYDLPYYVKTTVTRGNFLESTLATARHYNMYIGMVTTNLLGINPFVRLVVYQFVFVLTRTNIKTLASDIIKKFTNCKYTELQLLDIMDVLIRDGDHLVLDVRSGDVCYLRV
jgi:hypothetical protein